MNDFKKKLNVPKDGPLYWLYSDGSHRALTAEDGGAINAMMHYMNIALDALREISTDRGYMPDPALLFNIAKQALSQIEDQHPQPRKEPTP